MTFQAHIPGEPVTVKLSGAGCTGPFVRDQSFLMRVMAGDASDPAFLVERQNNVKPGLHLGDLRPHLIGRFAQVSLMQRLLGGGIVTPHADRPVIADEFYVFYPGLFLVGNLGMAVQAFFPNDLTPCI